MAQAARRRATEHIDIRLTPEIYERIRQAVRGSGQTHTDFVRESILYRLAEVEEGHRDALEKRKGRDEERKEQRKHAAGAFTRGVESATPKPVTPAAPTPVVDAGALDRIANYILAARDPKERERRLDVSCEAIRASSPSQEAAETLAKALDERIAGEIKKPVEKPAENSIFPKGGLRSLLPDWTPKL